jgi:sec-independent protein translocase protein TatA
MFGLSLEHLIVIGFVLLLFGARRLPELGSSMGQALKNFKRSFEPDRAEVDPLDPTRMPTPPKPTPQGR